MNIYQTYSKEKQENSFYKNKKDLNELFNTTTFKFNNRTYRRLNDIKLIGAVQDFVHKNDIRTMKQFLDLYFDTNYGVTKKDFGQLCNIFKTACNKNAQMSISLERAVALMVEFVFYNTIVGDLAENTLTYLINDELKKNGLVDYHCQYSGSYYDNVCGIDLVIINKNGDVLYGIQVKPNSINYCKNEACKDQILLTQEKNKKFGKPYAWFYYSIKRNGEPTLKKSSYLNKIQDIMFELVNNEGQ